MKPIPIVIAVIIGIVIAAFFMKSCHLGTDTITKTDTFYHDTTITVHDTTLVPYEVLVHGKPVQVTKHDTIKIPTNVPLTHTDSIAIFNDFFVVRKYSDTLRHAYGNVIISNTVTQNKLTEQSAIFNFHVPEVTKTIIEKHRTGYIGANAGAGAGIGMFGLDFLYVDKKDRLFRIKADYTTLGGPFFEGGIATKIKLF